MPFPIRILCVDDDPVICQLTVDLLDGETIDGCMLSAESESDFSSAHKRLETGDFDIVILDVYKGDPSEKKAEMPGKDALEKIKEVAPVIVVFYTGLTSHVEALKSDVVRVVSKTSQNINAEIEVLIKSGIPAIRRKLAQHLQETLRSYFWDFFDKGQKFDLSGIDKSLAEYLILRRLATTLTREGASKIFGASIARHNVHPLEFYICPPVAAGYETGDILQNEKDKSFHVVLTPSCDISQGYTAFILLAAGYPLTEDDVYKKYVRETDVGKRISRRDALGKFIQSRTKDQYFVLPQNEFINMPDTVVDFHNVNNFSLKTFSGYTKVAKIDDPFAQDMLASYIRNRNRPGSPDLDAEYVLARIDRTIAASAARPDDVQNT